MIQSFYVQTHFLYFRIDLSKLYKIDEDILAITRDLKVTCSYTASSSVFEFAACKLPQITSNGEG